MLFFVVFHVFGFTYVLFLNVVFSGVAWQLLLLRSSGTSYNKATTRIQKKIQLLISFNRSSKHIKLIAKLHFNSWFVISCSIWSWNPIILHLCSVQLSVLQMKRTETNWTWSNEALASSVNLVRFIASSVFLKTPFEHTNRPGPRPPTLPLVEPGS